MATHKSAEKRHRQSLKLREKNRNDKSAIRTTLKRAAALTKSGDKAGALDVAKKASSLIDKAVSHGVLHKNTAKRTISRLHKNVNSAA